MRAVSIVGTGQLPVQAISELSLREMGARVTRLAMAEAGVDRVDALFSGNMLSDELQGQKHLAALIADEAGLSGIEALEAGAVTASGAAALRMAFLAVASGQADLAVAVGAEKMSDGVAMPAISKALDADREVANGATMITRNAELLALYFQRTKAPAHAMVWFAVNAHKNARNNPYALFHEMRVSVRKAATSRVIQAPLRLYDCAPICDGAAAVVLAPTDQARAFSDRPVRILASSVATDRFRLDDRSDPLFLEGSQLSAHKAFRQANVHRGDVSFFEVHDAFSIMACLQLEAVGFAEPGEGWRLAADRRIGIHGRLPICTMGGLKARGHPIGASGIYQAVESVLQLTGRAGRNQVRDPKVALMQSIGGAASTVITHIFGM
ncbi:MAG TPA: thiolase domain-containing protein [Anaerolineales bacterium]|nr:thiolase domain-containing protein [Anaerolineales bacterium]